MNNCKSSTCYTKITIEHLVGHWNADRPCKSGSCYTYKNYSGVLSATGLPTGRIRIRQAPMDHWFSATSSAAVLVVVEQGAARRSPCSHSSSHRHCLPFATCCCMFTRVCVGRPGEQENMFPVRRKVWDVTAGGMKGSAARRGLRSSPPEPWRDHAFEHAIHRRIGAFMPIHCLLARRRPARLTA